MLKWELKSNFKSFLIWVIAVSLLLVLVFVLYPSLSSNSVMMDQLMKEMPEELLTIFNMDLISIGSAWGWVATEGYLLINILGGCFFAIMGATVLSKEESQGTISFLLAKPISRHSIVKTKLITGLIYLVVFNLIIALVIMLGLFYNREFHLSNWLFIMLGTFLLQLFFFLISLFMSLIFYGSRKSIMMGIGIVLGTYFIEIISKMSRSFAFLKYFSPFHYVNSSMIITNGYLSGIGIIILVVMSFLLIYMIYYFFDHKEFDHI